MAVIRRVSQTGEDFMNAVMDRVATEDLSHFAVGLDAVLRAWREGSSAE